MGTVVFECPPNVGNYSAYSRFNSLPGGLHSLKNFKCMCQLRETRQMISDTNVLPSSRMPKMGLRKQLTTRRRPQYPNLWVQSESQPDSNIKQKW